MKKFSHIIIMPLIIFGAQTSSAAVLTFEDVPEGSLQDKFGNMLTYKGFDFSRTPTLDWIDVTGPNWNYGARSGDFALVNNEGGTGEINAVSNTYFTFDGLWAKKWGTSPDSGGVDSLLGTLSGYNNGVQIWLVNTSLNGSYEFYGPQAGLIDKLKLGFGNNFLVDDIVLNAVPAPAAIWLFGSGLIALAGAARRKAQA
ncbi:MAG: hypothetical protein BMS9Abin19_0939 [Gammaproteobacteria bacterium]|nr:MAG: hypothetical protein BMS9Abin19_0939 [Gammaproteobacteria bacterium]